jgi:hypothetical protein
MGATCGRREREAGAGHEEEQSFHVPVAATVEGTLVHGMPIAFAGCRRSVSLGRSDAGVWGSFPGIRSHRRQQVSSGRMRRGTSSACARRTHSSRETPKKRLHVFEDTSFARSRDPCTSIGTELPRGNSRKVSRRSRHRGRANLGNQEEPAPGSRSDGRMRGSPRVTAVRGNSSRSCVMRKKRKVVMATVPARKRESGIFRPYVVSSCRSWQAASRPRISTYAARQKAWRYE